MLVRYFNMNTHIMPFLWVHGEEKTVYREMIGAIYDANIRAFCVEARPHENFCKEQWWHDMDVILDEAERRGMKVWILDDKHFPTGYANGGLENALLSQHRRNVFHTTVPAPTGKVLKLRLGKYTHPHFDYGKIQDYIMRSSSGSFAKKIGADELVSVSAIGFLPSGQKKILNLSSYVLEDVLCWTAPEGRWTVEICASSLDTGTHRSYINMMNKAACRIQIDQVYEPHYEHYKDKFGTVIAGFFSDEPELGNGSYLFHGNVLGTEQDLPYSDELEEKMEERLGAGWKSRLPLLWRNDYDEAETAHFRYAYMDEVTRLVEEDFSRQIGSWCRERGVEYIGHVIEDENQHARTATSLGHYFRGLKWQTMAGIDDIGGQVYPQGEDFRLKSGFGDFENDGEFYHYALGKLGASLAALNPNMKGRAMCEVFGNYGWGEGVRLEKYLVDHFMVRGINHFVPHAFTCKSFPDPDCPPHFYAHGHNPQYRHFGQLMAYTERVCGMISGGKAETPVGILYHGEAEWAGKCMLMQKPARVLWDNQTDYLFVPADVFEEPDFYKTKIGKKLTVNGHAFELLVIPYAQFIPQHLADGIAKLLAAGARVCFIDALPEGICDGDEAKLALPKAVAACPVVALADLAAAAEDLRLVRVTPASDRLRVMHYEGGEDFYYLFNEAAEPFEGTVKLPVRNDFYAYDPWLDRAEQLEFENGEVVVRLDPSESLFLIHGDCPEAVQSDRQKLQSAKNFGVKLPVTEMKLRKATAAEYPAFGPAAKICAKNGVFPSFAALDKANAGFSGYLQYRTDFDYDGEGTVSLEITDAREGVEVFVNGRSAGIQVIPSFRYDLTPYLRKGANELVIEVATTLENALGRGLRMAADPYPAGLPLTGITGEVNLYFTQEETED